MVGMKSDNLQYNTAALVGGPGGRLSQVGVKSETKNIERSKTKLRTETCNNTQGPKAPF